MVYRHLEVAPAFVCGNTVVLKPVSLTPLTALRLGEGLGLEAGVYPPACSTSCPARVLRYGAALVAHPDVAKISFTGETATGRVDLWRAAVGNDQAPRLWSLAASRRTSFSPTSTSRKWRS